MTRSRLPLLIAGILAVGAILPAAARAQTDTTTVAHRIFQYESTDKSLGLAVALNFMPPLGHWYAGDVKRGLIPASLVWGGVVTQLFVAGECLEYDRWDNCLRYENEGEAEYVAIGFISAIGLVWGLVDAYSTANDYNRRLREQLQLTVRPAGSGVQIRGEWALSGGR